MKNGPVRRGDGKRHRRKAFGQTRRQRREDKPFGFIMSGVNQRYACAQRVDRMVVPEISADIDICAALNGAVKKRSAAAAANGGFFDAPAYA